MPNTVTPPLPRLPQTPVPAHSSHPVHPQIVPFALLVVVLFARLISMSMSSVPPLTDQRVDGLLCLSLQLGKLLLRLPLEIPVRPFRCNVEYVLLALSRAQLSACDHPQVPALCVVHPLR